MKPWIRQEEILKCEFLHQPYAICSQEWLFRLVVISAIINRSLCMTSALTFFLIIFFRNSGKPLMKFSFTNSSPSTSWSFLNPSAQKKNELIMIFSMRLIQACEYTQLPLTTPRPCLWGCIMREFSAIHLKGAKQTKLVLKYLNSSHVLGVY